MSKIKLLYRAIHEFKPAGQDKLKLQYYENSLSVRWLGLGAFTACGKV